MFRRSCQGGFFLPLSGGVDSSSSACIVYSMCEMIVESVGRGGKIWLCCFPSSYESFFAFRKLHFVFRHTGLSGYQEDCRRLRIRTDRSEAIMQYHLGHVLHGNGKLVGGDQGPSGRVGQSNRVLSSWDSHRYRDIRDFRDLPTGY